MTNNANEILLITENKLYDGLYVIMLLLRRVEGAIVAARTSAGKI